LEIAGLAGSPRCPEFGQVFGNLDEPRGSEAMLVSLSQVIKGGARAFASSEKGVIKELERGRQQALKPCSNHAASGLRQDFHVNKILPMNEPSSRR